MKRDPWTLGDWAALCMGSAMALMATAVLIISLTACTKKPAPTKPGPAPEKDYGSETALADAGRGRGLSLYDADKPFSRVLSVEYAPIYFALNGTALNADALETLSVLIEESPKYKACRIEGHTCPLGETAYNQALGYHRAQVILSYLRTAGVRTGFRVISYGEERPATEDPAEYALNRRVIVECEK